MQPPSTTESNTDPTNPIIKEIRFVMDNPFILKSSVSELKKERCHLLSPFKIDYRSGFKTSAQVSRLNAGLNVLILIN